MANVDAIIRNLFFDPLHCHEHPCAK